MNPDGILFFLKKKYVHELLMTLRALFDVEFPQAPTAPFLPCLSFDS
jgi:hypothetical protein